MVLDNIEQLLEKYDNGETTLQEEQQLKNYFSQETVAPHLEVYKPMFMYFLQTQKEQFTKEIPLQPKKTYTLYKWISVAAIAVLMFAVYTQVGNQPVGLNDLSQDELMAYNQTVEAFNLLASNLNKGVNSMEYLGEFNKATNTIFKK